MAKNVSIQKDLIMSKIYMIRGQKVMLDRDLAEMYGVETRRLNEQVKRNMERFPISFMFKLTGEEVETMVSQKAIPSKQILGGSLPNVFSEHGVLMLANVLKSKQAIQVSIRIIEIFTQLRELLLSNKDVLIKLEQLDKKITHIGFDVKMHDGEIESIFELINEIKEDKRKIVQPKNPIGFPTKSSGKVHPSTKQIKSLRK